MNQEQTIATHEDSDGTGYCRGCGTTIGESHHNDCGVQFYQTVGQQEQMMNIYKKLMTARVMLQNTELKKSGHNKFAGYDYFELADFLPATQRIFAEVGLCGLISFFHDHADLTITDMDTGEQIVIASPMAEANLKGCHPIQNLGAVQAYLRRYLWTAAMEIVEHDALDATTGKETPKSFKTIAQDVKDNLSADRRECLFRMAADINAAMDESDEQGYKAYMDVKAKLGNMDEQAALWSFFDSKQRAKIKAIGQQAKENTIGDK